MNRSSIAARTRSPAALPSMAAAGMSNSAATACNGAMPAPFREAPGRWSPSCRNRASASSCSPTPSRAACRRASPISLLDLVLKGKIEKDWIGAWNAGYASLFGPAIEAAKAQFAHPPSPAAPPLANSAYLGRYANDYFGTAVIAEDGGKLVLGLGPTGQRRFPLAHFDRDLFLMISSPEMPDLSSAVTFTIGPDGKADRVTLDAYDDLGFGTLKRVE